MPSTKPARRVGGEMIPASEPLDVEISVVNHDRCDLSRACLALLPAACDGLGWHATIIDNASPDESADILRAEFPDITVVRNLHRKGFGFNHNQVIGSVVESGAARYVLVLNNDTELDTGSVAELVRYADQNRELAAVGPLTLNSDGSCQPSSFRFPNLFRAAISQVHLRAAPLGCTVAEDGRTWLGGACLLLRTNALRVVGSFDPRFFMFFEDIDLGKRLWDSGWKSALCPSASIVHHNHGTVALAELRFPMECQMRRSLYLYAHKHFGPVPAECLVSLAWLALRLRAIKAAIHGSLTHSEAIRSKGRFLRDLSRYDPRRLLPHELPAA